MRRGSPSTQFSTSFSAGLSFEPGTYSFDVFKDEHDSLNTSSSEEEQIINEWSEGLSLMYDSDAAASHYIRSCDGNAVELPDGFLPTSPSDELPDNMRWKFDPMYKISETGLQWVWQVGFDGVSIWILYGSISSTKISTTVVEPKAKRSMQEQAYLECKALHLNKYRDGYRYIGDERPQHINAMKGYEYTPGCLKLMPVVVDWKLDGIRATARMNDGQVSLLSYGNVSFDHIRHVSDDVKDFLMFLPDSCMIDGELYRHGIDRHRIQSIISSRVNIHPELSTLKYCIFDIQWPEDLVIERRYEILVAAYNSYRALSRTETSLVLITKKWFYSENEIIEEFNASIRAGCEGIVIRQSSINREVGSREWWMSKYVFGRTRALLKMKLYMTDEGVVCSVQATKGKEKKLCKIVVRTRDGYNLPVRFGNAQQKEEWRNNPYTILGKVLNYKYPSVHPETGIPQMAVGLSLREAFA